MLDFFLISLKFLLTSIHIFDADHLKFKENCIERNMSCITSLKIDMMKARQFLTQRESVIVSRYCIINVCIIIQ